MQASHVDDLFEDDSDSDLEVKPKTLEEIREERRRVLKLESEIRATAGRTTVIQETQAEKQQLQIKTAEAQEHNHQESVALQLLANEDSGTKAKYAKQDSHTKHEKAMAAATALIDIVRSLEAQVASLQASNNEKTSEIQKWKMLLVQTRKDNSATSNASKF